MKSLVGLILFIGGIVLVFYAIHHMQQFTDAKGLTQDVENFFSHNPSWWNEIIKFFGGTPQQEPTRYDLTGLGLLISGIVLAVGGSVICWAGWSNRRS